MRDDSITPSVKDVVKQIQDPQSAGSRGLKDQVERKLRGHSMRDLLNIIDQTQEKKSNDASKC